MTAAAVRRYLDPNAVCVVSGASRGIGLAIARLWLDRSVGSIICLGRDAPRSAGIAELGAEFSGRVSAVGVDLTDPVSVNAAVTSIDELARGRVDVLVNVAGILGDGRNDPG